MYVDVKTFGDVIGLVAVPVEVPKSKVSVEEPIVVAPVKVCVEVTVLVAQVPYGHELTEPPDADAHTSLVAFAAVGTGKYRTCMSLPLIVQPPPHADAVLQPFGTS